MNGNINIYCDESCHLVDDGQKSMVLGCLIVEKEYADFANAEIKKIKEKWGVSRFTEIKWTKVSLNKSGLYRDVIQFFLSYTPLRFRCVLVPDKQILSHEMFNQTHDDFYYKMFYTALSTVVTEDFNYKVFFDYKDRYEMQKVKIIKQCLINKKHLPEDRISLQLVHSFESQLIQVADILIGAVIYKNRGVFTSEAKTDLVEVIERELTIDLSKTSSRDFTKFNILRWISSKGGCQ